MILAVLFLVIAGCKTQSNSTEGLSAKTAIAIARDAVETQYGRLHARKMAPYKATYNNGIWHVRGTLPRRYIILLQHGGVPEVDIDGRTGEVISIWHSK